MSKRIMKWVIGLVMLGLPAYGLAEDNTGGKERGTKSTTEINKSISIDVNRESPEVGKKRVELLEKWLTPALIARRGNLVHQYEEDYNRKISKFIQEVTTNNSKNTVITHVDIHLFDPGFKEQIEVEKDVTVSAILGRGGFDLWKKDQTEEQALEKLRQLISGAFRIPPQHVILVVGP